MAIITNLDREKCYLDISIDEKPIGRIVIELFNDLAPLSSENFLKLCTGEAGKNAEGINLSFKGNYFHRAIKNFIIQAGDIVHCSDLQKYPPSADDLNIIGTGGASVYLDNDSDISDEVQLHNKFIDENLANSTFETTFNVAMSNNDENSNTSQFFINTYPSPHLNNKHPIFGKVLHGKSVIREIENVPIISKDNYFPIVAVKIENCGKFEEGMEIPCYNACYDTIGGDIYEEYPDDDSCFNKDDYAKVFKVCETIKNSGNCLFKSKDFKNCLFKFTKALRYVEELQPEKDVLITQSNTEQQNLTNYKLYIDFLLLKKSLYSNMSLAYLKLEKYADSIKYSKFMIDMIELYPKYEPKFKVEKSDFVKCYYRIGKCYMLWNRLDKSKDFLTKASDLNNQKDKLILKDLETVENMIIQKEEGTKKSLAKFFQ
ncbi:peptidylprolyl isomerase [Saccharomycopsis crataegensis]|uniref:peptidylprolyl isomerase n=1 Tax=Saccharomycopsis crataegensis TaxID=43959 RepID=A0AAV5QMK7_9ASCO|nr:peptidylprolyl isomerase [Saccharomycopsis crataegensis]